MKFIYVASIFENLNKQLTDYNHSIKISADMIKKKQEILSSLCGKVTEYRNKIKETDPVMESYKKKNLNTTALLKTQLNYKPEYNNYNNKTTNNKQQYNNYKKPIKTMKLLNS